MSEEITNGQASTDSVVDESAVVETQAAATDEATAHEQGQPVEYTDFTVPEGVALDADALGEFVPFAKELKLNQEQAQRLVDMGSMIASKMQQSSIENWQKQTSEWAEQTKADKEIGGKEFDANIGMALKAIETFGTPELKTLLDESGIGNHPEIVRFAYKIGKAIGEDRSFVSGSAAASQSKGLESIYTTMQGKG